MEICKCRNVLHLRKLNTGTCAPVDAISNLLFLQTAIPGMPMKRFRGFLLEMCALGALRAGRGGRRHCAPRRKSQMTRSELE
jgi:hypothetical protein